MAWRVLVRSVRSVDRGAVWVGVQLGIGSGDELEDAADETQAGLVGLARLVEEFGGVLPDGFNHPVSPALDGDQRPRDQFVE